MSKLYLDKSGQCSASNYASLVATIVGPTVEQIQTAPGEVPANLAGKELPILVKGEEVVSGGLAVGKAIVAGTEENGLAGNPDEVDKFVTYVLGDVSKAVSGDIKAGLKELHKLNKHVQGVTLVSGNVFTLGDVALLATLKGRINNWTAEERVALVSVCRWYDFVQNSKSIKSRLPADYQVAFVIDLPKVVAKTGASKEKKPEGEKATEGEKKAPAADKKAAEGEKKAPAAEKKAPAAEKKAPAATAAAESSSAAAELHRVDFRVGRIVECAKHPEADSLYVEKIDLGESTGPRTIVSGLVKFVPLEQMLNRLVVVVANLKPAKLKGVMSAGMVLAASNDDHTSVEVLDPPADAKIGERITFKGYEGDADAQLNPKKKIFEAVKPDLKTDASCIALYKDVPFMTSAGPCKVVSLANSTLG